MMKLELTYYFRVFIDLVFSSAHNVAMNINCALTEAQTA